MDDLRAFVRMRISPTLRAVESASDVLQSACLEILSHPNRFEFKGETEFKNWLYGAVLFKIRDHERYYRTQRRDPRRIVPLSDAQNVGLLHSYASFCAPSMVAIANEEVARIEVALDGLDEAQREIITLSRIIGMSHREIAEQLGIKEQSARARLHRALANLAVSIDRSGEHE
jgi:RNA polymerase sigma-70 factor, ECF subfamily